MRYFFLLFWFLVLSANEGRPDSRESIHRLVNEGHWLEANQVIQQQLANTNLAFPTRQDLFFQVERMSRMRLDFAKTRDQVFQEARKRLPALDDATFTRWEKAGFVESLNIDGTEWYFQRAADNLFRICPEARALKVKQPGNSKEPLPYSRPDIASVLASYDRNGGRFHEPRNWRVTYSIIVHSDMVPAGEVIRAWLPFAQEGNRQTKVRLIATDPPRHVVSGTTGTLASVYLEKAAIRGQPTEFKVSFEFSSAAYYQPIDPARVRPVTPEDSEAAPFLSEQRPHLVFSDEIRKLSRKVGGAETNLFLKARLFFKWVHENIPWAGAREYSTLDCLPEYVLAHRHGDCGMQTMLFMTLCRLNGIPARWESGWVFRPVINMHDWCEIYLAPYGWVPVDVSHGLVDSESERERWFYLGNLDAGRMVVNTDHQQPLFPAKQFYRSEIVDFQRGEVEWRGGNLFFNQWEWDFDVQEIPRPE